MVHSTTTNLQSHIRKTLPLFATQKSLLRNALRIGSLGYNGPLAMLKTPTRPRAPSAATLRVLYQLAYISSGTAVGIGALCAEERRRRTQIVQRVADNAKRIRQSPRYAHGAAAAAVRDHEVEDDYGRSGNDNEVKSDGSQRTEVGRRRARRLENLEGAKMPGLPSVVEEEYGKLAEGRHKKNMRRNRSGRPDFVEAHGQQETVSRADLEEQSSHGDRVLFRRCLGSGKNKKTSREWISYQRRLQYGLDTKHELQATSRTTQLFHATAQGKAYHDPRTTFDQVAESFATRHMWTGQDGAKLDLSAEILARDADVFFEIVDANSPLKTSMHDACKIADELLRLSLDLGSVEVVRSFLLWKLAVEALSVEDLFDTATSLASIADSLGHEEAIAQFYSDLFATPVYTGAKATERIRINLRLLAEALKLKTIEQHCWLYSRSLAKRFIVKLNTRGHGELLDQECRRLLDSGHTRSAVELWCNIWPTLLCDQQRDLQIEDDLFNAALTERHLSLCARILRRQEKRNFGDYSHQKDAFIKMCFEQGGTEVLRRMFGNTRSDLQGNEHLSPESYAYLSRCFADARQYYPVFELYYARVPLELRTSMVESGASDGSFALKAQWKATRNLDHVRAIYEHKLGVLEHMGLTEEAVRPLHVAMVEVELSANQPITALGALSQLNKTGSDGSVATLTALALAKQKKWAMFGRLFEALKKNGTILHWTPSTTRAFNNVLHLFSRSHSAQQLSDFATMVFSELGFRPNAATWEVLLSGLTSKRDIGLLKYWIKFSDASGGKFAMEARIGAAIMKQYYLDSRHSQSHVMVIWFCRTLAQRAYSMRSDALLNVVREAIGFDLRKLHGPNAPWMEPIICTRQALLDGSGGDIPEPGYIWNGRLYDKGGARDAVPLHLTLDQVTDTARSPLPSTKYTVGGARSEASAKTWVPYSSQQSANVTETSEAKDESFNSAVRDVRNTSSLANKSTALAGDAIDAETSTSTDDDVSVDDTRLSYKGRQSSAVTSKVEALERQMVSYFSLQQYDSAVELYHASLDATSLPASPLMLEVAIDASLRTENDCHKAEQILSAARDAGMNVTCAIGPLLIDKIRRASVEDRHGATTLRNQVMEYYHSNELNGLHVKHHVGTAAAHTLIQAGFAESGVKLLSAILRSDWCAEEPPNIATMSVWLLGHAALGHVKGMYWVVREVLAEGMAIDQGFMRALKRARRPLIRINDGPLTYKKQERKTVAYLCQWYKLCSRKRAAQMQASKSFGRKLVDLLASSASDGVATSPGGGYGAYGRRSRRPRSAPSREVKSRPVEVDRFNLGIGSDRTVVLA